MSEGALIDRIRLEVDALPADKIKEEYEALKVRRAQDLQKAKVRRENATPEQKQKAKERYQQYAAKPETKERAKAYREKPEVKEKTKAQAKVRRDRNSLIMKRALELGLDKDPAPAGDEGTPQG